MQITIDQLVAWHAHFVKLPNKSTKVKEIITALEAELHRIISQFKPVDLPPPNKES